MIGPTFNILDTARYADTPYDAANPLHYVSDTEIVMLNDTDAILFVAERVDRPTVNMTIRAYGVTWNTPGYRWAIDLGPNDQPGFCLTAVKIDDNHAAVFSANNTAGTAGNRWVTVSNAGTIVSRSAPSYGTYYGVTRNSVYVEGTNIYWASQPGFSTRDYSITIKVANAFDGSHQVYGSAGTTNLNGLFVAIVDKTHAWSVTQRVAWGGGTGFGSTGGIGHRFCTFARNPFSRTPPYGIEIPGANYYRGEMSHRLISLDTSVYPYGYGLFYSYDLNLGATTLDSGDDMPIFMSAEYPSQMSCLNANGTRVLIGGIFPNNTTTLASSGLAYSLYDVEGGNPPSRSFFFIRQPNRPGRYNANSPPTVSADQGSSKYMVALSSQVQTIDGSPRFYMVAVASGTLADFRGGAPTPPLRHRQNGIN